MSFRSSSFLYQDDFDAMIAVNDTDMLQSDGKLSLKIKSFIKSRKQKQKKKCEFLDKVSLSKTTTFYNEKGFF